MTHYCAPCVAGHSLSKLSQLVKMKMEIFADTGCAVLVSFLFFIFLHIANKQVVSSYKLEETRGGGAIDLLEKKKNSKGSTSVNSSPVGDALCLF